MACVRLIGTLSHACVMTVHHRAPKGLDIRSGRVLQAEHVPGG